MERCRETERERVSGMKMQPRNVCDVDARMFIVCCHGQLFKCFLISF